MPLKKFQNKYPSIHSTAWIADNALVIGDVHIGEYSSIWFGSVIRGDIHYIRIGSRSNIQDGTIMHVTSGKYPVEIGDFVTIGHGAVIHGCRVENTCLIGMGAVVLDGSIIEKGAIVAAGSVIREGFRVPHHTLAAGVPAVIKRDISEEECEQIKASAEHYRRMISRYRECNE